MYTNVYEKFVIWLHAISPLFEFKSVMRIIMIFFRFVFCFFFCRRLRLTQFWLGACQSSEYVRCMILVMRVLQQSLPLVRSRTVSYFRASRLRNGIGVHGFVHRIGKVALRTNM